MPAFASLQRHPPGVRGADALDHPGFFGSALYNEIWRPQGFHTRLEAVVRGRDGQLIGSLVLYRGRGDRRFTRDDERRLAAVLPAFAAGLQRGGPAVADTHHVASPEPAQTLLLPMLLARLREQVRCAPAQAGAPPPSITHDNAAGQFVATATLLHAFNPGHEPLVQVTLQRLEPHAVALERALRALPLTAGQMVVWRGLVQGQSHADISARLGVAPATAVDHVRKAYQALDVRSALGLRAVLDRHMGRA